MNWTLASIAQTLGLEYKGKDLLINGANTLEAAGPTDISFLSNPKYIKFLNQTNSGAVILTQEVLDSIDNPPFAALISKTPYSDFAKILFLFEKAQGSLSGIHEKAHIESSSTLGENCTVYPFAYIGPNAKIGNNCTIFPGVYIGENCVVGDGCIIFPNAVLMSHTQIGDECILHAGVVLGASGFGFVRMGESVQRIPQIGSVSLGNKVDIGANSTVDKGALGPTCIGDESKLDNQVQIGHNVQIGKRAIIVAQVGIAGSTHAGDDVTMAAKAGISGHLKIGNKATIGPYSGVAKDVPEGFIGGGMPLMEDSTFMRTLAITPKLPEMHKRLKRLEKELDELKKTLNTSKP